MPGPLIDCYIWKENSDYKITEKFIEHFMPKNKPLFDIGELIASDGVTNTRNYLFELHDGRTVNEGLYYSNEQSCKPYFIMVFILGNGKIIYGLSAEIDSGNNSQNKENAKKWLKEMDEIIKGEMGYYTVESPPELDFLSFKKISLNYLD